MNISNTFFKVFLTKIWPGFVVLVFNWDTWMWFLFAHCSGRKKVLIINPAMIYFYFTVGVRDWTIKPLTVLYYIMHLTAPVMMSWTHTWNIKWIFVLSTLRPSTLSLFQLTNEQVIQIIAQTCVLWHVFTESSTRNQHWNPCWSSLSRAKHSLKLTKQWNAACRHKNLAVNLKTREHNVLLLIYWFTAALQQEHTLNMH